MGGSFLGLFELFGHGERSCLCTVELLASHVQRGYAYYLNNVHVNYYVCHKHYTVIFIRDMLSE
jgi:hypothetical protein